MYFLFFMSKQTRFSPGSNSKAREVGSMLVVEGERPCGGE